ncbi:MAG: hypothetical protein RI924_951 [Bacteroidota bacterium]
MSVLTLAIGFLLIARYTPALMVNIIGTNGRSGQLAKICECSQNTVLVEEIIDNDSGIGVEGGAGFNVQLKKLLLVDIDTRRVKKFGLHINSMVIGCSLKYIWIFNAKRGISAILIGNGKQINQEKIIEINPNLKGLPGIDFQSFSLSRENHELIIIDHEERYWQLDEQLHAYQLRSTPQMGYAVRHNLIIEEKTEGGIVYRIKLGPASKQMIFGEIAVDADLVFRYKNKRKEGLRICLMEKDGAIQWQQNFDQLLDRKNEQFRPVAVYERGKIVLVILDTNRGTRLLWLDLKSGVCIKNQRV